MREETAETRGEGRLIVDWDRVRLPGVFMPSRTGPYRFVLKCGAKKVSRAAFERRLEVTSSDYISFVLYTPTSRAMFPDIVRGDFGFPTVFLRNERGTFFRFARGNMKDFFDIRRPNEPQRVVLPFSSFVFDSDHTKNVADEGDFFSHLLDMVSFDFLSHPDDDIDIVVDEIAIEKHADRARFAVQDLVLFERVGQARQLPAFSTEAGAISLGVSLSSAGVALGAAGATLSLRASQEGADVAAAQVTLRTDPCYATLALPRPGAYQLAAEVRRDGMLLAASAWPACRVLPRAANGPATILGISDEFEYDRLAAVGGSFDRIPVALQSVVVDPSCGHRFAAGVDPLPVTHPGPGRGRFVAAYAMPKWLSRQGDRPDYHRYAPGDWDAYEALMTWMADRARRAGATHYEVWNEASALGHWNDDLGALLRMHEVTQRVFKRVAPEIVVLGGGTHSWTFAFLQSFLEAGGAGHCDGLAVHGYTYQPWDYLEHFDRLDALLAPVRRDRPEFKAFITEIGFRHPAFTLEDQALYLALYSLEAAARSSIGACLWFRFMNNRPELLSAYRQNSSFGYAIVGANNSYCRPSYAAFRHVELLLRSGRVVARGPAEGRRYDVEDAEGKLVARAFFGHAPDRAELPAGFRLFDIYGGPIAADAVGRSRLVVARA
ncbi:hypothetical protein [Salinarimonas sp.]|uniref:hypothetical protein n=1 Tax=Salinarimonas sp. TaxID=2766526 RepID=UPI0032D99146